MTAMRQARRRTRCAGHRFSAVIERIEQLTNAEKRLRRSVCCALQVIPDGLVSSCEASDVIADT